MKKSERFQRLRYPILFETFGCQLNPSTKAKITQEKGLEQTRFVPGGLRFRIGEDVSGLFGVTAEDYTLVFSQRTDGNRRIRDMEWSMLYTDGTAEIFSLVVDQIMKDLISEEPSYKPLYPPNKYYDEVLGEDFFPMSALGNRTPTGADFDRVKKDLCLKLEKDYQRTE